MNTAITQAATPVRLVGMEWLNAHTISLRLQPEQPYDFLAGQYLNLPLPSSQKTMSFSIASRPHQGEHLQNAHPNTLEIQIGGVLSGSELASDIVEFRSQWLNQQPFYLGQAAGEAYFRETGSSVTVIAGGSGFSYAKSIVLQALSLPKAGNITLYWGAKSVADLYEHTAMVALAKQHPQFHYVPVVEALTDGDHALISNTVQMHQGKLLYIFFANHPLSTEQDIYICGRYQMVQTAYQQILDNNPELANRVYSDALPTAHKR